MHIVTLGELMPAMNTDIVLASSAKTHKAKDLKYNPAELKYRVRFHDGNSETSNSYHDPIEAIEKYNSYNT